MRTTKLITLTVAALVIAACHSVKKNTAPAVVVVPTPAMTKPTPPPTTLPPASKPADGIYAPGEEEVAAVKVQYPEVTLEKLNLGYTIYAFSACINCHGPMNIYKYSETQWKGIIDDMALRAMLPEKQKDAVYKYVLAIKAMQPK